MEDQGIVSCSTNVINRRLRCCACLVTCQGGLLVLIYFHARVMIKENEGRNRSNVGILTYVEHSSFLQLVAICSRPGTPLT